MVCKWQCDAHFLHVSIHKGLLSRVLQPNLVSPLACCKCRSPNYYHCEWGFLLFVLPWSTECSSSQACRWNGCVGYTSKSGAKILGSGNKKLTRGNTAQKLFDKMHQETLTDWNSIISRYSKLAIVSVTCSGIAFTCTG